MLELNWKIKGVGMKKYKIIFMIIMCFIYLSGFNYRKTSMINPKYEEYLKLSEEDKALVKLIPPKYIYGIEEIDDEIKESSKNKILGTSVFPTTYNLRDVNGTNYVPATKDQEDAGLCWSFSTTSSLESYLLRHNIKKNGVAFNFSENVAGYVAKYYGDVSTIISGNYLYMAMKYWFKGNGPVEESLFGAFTDTSIPSKTMDLYMDNGNVPINIKGSDFLGGYDYSVIKTYSFNNQKAIIADINVPIKEHLMTNGAIATGMMYYFGFYDRNENTFFDDGTVPDSGTANYTEYMSSGHAVTIIGWDDNKYDVNDDGVGDGAWLALNSWGTCTTCNEIFWISYYDSSSLAQKLGVTSASLKDYDNLYTKYYANPTLPATNTRKHTFYVGDADEEVTGVRIYNLETTSPTNALANNFTISVKSKTGDVVTSKSIEPVWGYQTISFDDVIVNGVVEVTVNGILSNELFDIALLTKDSVSTKKVYSTTSIEDNTNFNNELNSKIDYAITTKNITSGKTLGVKVLDASDKDISSKFTITKDSNLLNGQMNASIKLKETLDTFKIKVNLTIDNVTKTFTYTVFSLEGAGTAISPYLIEEPTDLIYLEDSDKYFKLVNDLDIKLYTSNKSGVLNTNNKGWKPINFSGHLDGNGKTIYGLTSKLGGLFSNLSGSVNNLRIKYANISCEGTTAIEMSCGSLANISSNGIVTNTEISNSTIKGTMYSGALFGAATGGSITNVNVNSSEISATGNAGGLIGNICISDDASITITRVFITSSKIYLFGTNNTLNPGYIGGTISYNVTETNPMPTLNMNNNYYSKVVASTGRDAVNSYTSIISEVYNGVGNKINNYDATPYIILSENKLLSDTEYKVSSNYLTFDFTNYWVMNSSSVPVLKKFVKASVIELDYDIENYTTTDNKLYVSERLTGLALSESITVPEGVTYKIHSKNGSIINNSANVGTGSIIVITNGEDITYLPIIVLGDVTGDGSVNVSDVTFVADYVLYSQTQREAMLDNEYQLIAANVIQSQTTGINIADVTKIADYTLDPSKGW